jgi:hypothetical protein
MLNLKIQDGIPDPHPFLDISWRDLIPQSNHKLQESKQGIRGIKTRHKKKVYSF